MQKSTQRFDILGVELNWLVPLAATEDRYCMLAARIPHGVGIPPHRHPDQEAFYVLAGAPEFAAETGGKLKWAKAEPGELINVEADALHGFRNTSGADVRILITCTEGLGRFFDEAGAPLAEGEEPNTQPTPEQVGRVLSIAEKHGQRFAIPA